MSQNLKRLSSLGIALLSAMAFASIVLAMEAQSWNLSHDMSLGIAKNPNGVWAFMRNTYQDHVPTHYSLLPVYEDACGGYVGFSCWRSDEPGSLPAVGIVRGTKPVQVSGLLMPPRLPDMHPGANGSYVAVRWRSPITGTINISGRFSDMDTVCGDGIGWFIDRGAYTLAKGVLGNGEGGTFLLQKVPVQKYQNLYFVVTANGNNCADSTALDLLITSQQ